MKTAVVAGATGLTGKELVHQLLENPRYQKVIALTRSPWPHEHARFTNLVTDFTDLEKVLAGHAVDDIFCCLGTTIAKAGSKEKFREVDFAYPLALAKATLAQGATQYLLVSALGADKDSAIFYNRVKGEVEQEMMTQPFSAVHIFRPSLLLGPREEKRPGEEAAKVVYKYLGFLIPEKYKGIEARTVAKAMQVMAAREAHGVFIHQSREMQQFA